MSDPTERDYKLEDLKAARDVRLAEMRSAGTVPDTSPEGIVRAFNLKMKQLGMPHEQGMCILAGLETPPKRKRTKPISPPSHSVLDEDLGGKTPVF